MKEISLKSKIMLLTKKSLIIYLNCINKQQTLNEHPLKKHMTALATQKLEESQHLMITRTKYFKKIQKSLNSITSAQISPRMVVKNLMN